VAKFEDPVLIAGAGPVGLSLALGLSRHGIPVEVFEADEDLSQEMRASTIHASTLEMYEEWGVVDEIIARGEQSTRLQFWERSTKTKIADLSFESIAGDTKYPFRLQCPQNLLTRVLRAELETIHTCRLHFGHKAINSYDDGQSVRLVVQTANGSKTIKGSYLVGCDGAHSGVRQSLDFNLTGKTYADRFLLVGTNIDFNRYFEGVGPVAYIYDPKEWAIIMKLPTMVRTVFRVNADEDREIIMSETAIRRRIWDLIGCEDPFEIQMSSIYSVHQRIADSFRKGRVILAGDAAHLNNPTGGMGLNSGVHDAYLLAQAFLRFSQGESDTVFDDYSTDRREAASSWIQSASDENYKDLVLEDWEARKKRNDAMTATAANQKATREYLLNAALLRQRPRPLSSGRPNAK